MNKWAARLFGAAFLVAALTMQAQNTTTSITNNFDTSTSTGGWTYWYDFYNGSFNTIILSWDGTMNHDGGSGSGSVLFTNLWAGHAAGSGQCQIWGTFANKGGNQYDQSVSIDGTKYDTITFDVHANANCPTNLDGNVCRLTVGFWTQNYQVHGTTNVDIPITATNGWYHVVALVNKADAGLSTPATGWALNINCYGGRNANLPGSTNNTFLWIDGIQVNRAKSIAPPPVMSTKITRQSPGLNLFLNNQFDRTSVKLADQYTYGFLGSPDTTYYFTIDSFPNPAVYSNNQAHIFIATPNTASSIDYNTTNLLWLNVQPNTSGTATAYFRYKIFEPGANTNLFGPNYTVGPLGTPWAGQLASLGASTAVGTWGLTFHQDTNVTMFGPGGVATNFVIDPNVAAQFTTPLDIVYGAQPNNATPATGRPVILSEAAATNINASVVDTFTNDNGVLNPAVWVKSAAVAADVQVWPVDPGQVLVNWSIPDTFFALETATNITGPWTILTGSQALSPLTTFTVNGNNALVPSANLSPDHSFFRLFTAKFTKLQILMPGEIATPGVAPGKTGTPDTQVVGAPFNVTVNAVDANWNPAPYGTDLDNIHITSSDTSATLPADAQLVGGTGNFSVTFNAAGMWTVTASDTTQSSISPDTGTSTQAQ